jgi:hypothetical protein
MGVYADLFDAKINLYRALLNTPVDHITDNELKLMEILSKDSYIQMKLSQKDKD